MTQAMEDYVAVLRRYQTMTFDDISADTETAWAIEHGLQLCIQRAIDVCAHFIAELNLGRPATHQETVELLVQSSILPADLRRTLVQMFGFRNILVHVYLKVELHTVYDMLQTGLDDFGRFGEQVMKFLERVQTKD